MGWHFMLTFSGLHKLAENKQIPEVEPRGFEPLTSAVQRRQDTLPGVSGVCKIPANGNFSLRTLCSSFQEI
jgi:hypothetical protein